MVRISLVCGKYLLQANFQLDIAGNYSSYVNTHKGRKLVDCSFCTI